MPREPSNAASDDRYLLVVCFFVEYLTPEKPFTIRDTK